MQLKATEIFSKNYNSKARIVVNRGGTRSSKTYSLIQLFIMKAMTEKEKRIVIVRKTLTILRDTVLTEFEKFIYLEGAKAGQEGVRPTQQQSDANVQEKQQQWQDEQEGYRRLREQGQPTPEATQEVAAQLHG